jgi:hypothetical protein
MKRIGRHNEFLITDPAALLGLLKEWRPWSFGISQKKQEKELGAWLRRRLPDVPIVAQYGIAKGKAGLVIADSHIIEVKLGFDEGNVVEFDRCIGQLERYRQKWIREGRGTVCLVVVGASDEELRDVLHTWLREANGAAPMQLPYALIEKLPEE